MSTIDEKRVHGANTDAVALFVASELGVARVAVAGERVGETALVHEGPAHDLAVSDQRLAVATDEDVFLLEGEFEPTGFGPATALGFDGDLVAADSDGVVARLTDDRWHDIDTIPTVRAVDGDLLATTEGVYRLAGDELRYAGLTDVRDVTATETPHAATRDGLFRLGNGWMDVLDGAFVTVAAGTNRAHAATANRLYERADGEWGATEIERSVADVAYAGGVYAVCTDGTLLVDAGESWREHPLGVGETHAIVAGPTDRKPV